MRTIAIRYVGPKPLPFRVRLPIPYVTHGPEDFVECNPIGEFPAEDAERLLALGSDNFERVESGEAPAKTPKTPPARPAPPKARAAVPPAPARATPRTVQRRGIPGPYANAGLAGGERKKFFPGATIEERSDGWWIVPAPSPTVEGAAAIAEPIPPTGEGPKE